MKFENVNKSLEFIDSWLKLNYKNSEMPGFVVGISYNEKLILNKAYGYANNEKKEKLTPNHIFRIASQSKTFTATAIMQLVEKNSMRLDDPVLKYLPWLNKHKDKRFYKITIQNLLSHSSGIIRDGVDSDFWSLERSFPDEDVFQKDILGSDLVFNNNSRLKYSNNGFTMLGLVIENITGSSYNDYVIENIIKPLRLSNTGPEYLKLIDKKVAVGYSTMNENKKRIPIENVNTRIMSSATGFYSTSEDLCKYFNAHMIGSGKLLSDKSKKEMQKKQWRVKNTKDKEWYGIGMMIDEINKINYVGHSGGFPGYITNSMFDPDNKIVVVVLTNSIDGAATSKTKAIINVLNEYAKNGNKKKSKQDLRKYEGRFMNIWGSIEIIVIGNKIMAISPNSWAPFEEPEKLKYVNNKTLQIVKTNSYAAEGEFVKYNFDNIEKIISIVFAGHTLYPERDFFKKQKGLRKISLKRKFLL